LTRHGYPITADQVLDRFLGVSDREARTIVEAELGRGLPDAFETQMKQAALQRYADDLRLVPYVGEAIAAINLPKCVASSGTPEKIRHGLQCAGLYDLLAPHIFSASQVKRGKPAPDLFLFAAGQMKVSPARCVVIEDSVPGVTGARAAGMTVLGFHGGSHCRPGYADRLRAAGAALTFDDMRELAGLIGQIGTN
jgi:HAD superfamily hydrolase (TIGR01509 family)